jgi:PKD repeat protein
MPIGLKVLNFSSINDSTPEVTILSWSATRPNELTNFGSSTLLEIAYTNVGSPPNVFTDSYSVPIPTGLTGSQVIGTYDVQLSWGSSAGSDNYVVQRATDPGFTTGLTTAYDGPLQTALDGTPGPNIYYYRVLAQVTSLSLNSYWSSTFQITVINSVSVDFSADPLLGSAPLVVQFTDLSLGGPTSWDWDFGDSSPHSTDQNPSHTYTVAGVYTVSLSINSGALTETKVDYITVNLSADFIALTRAGRLPLSVKFLDQTTGEPTAWDWDFGDSTPHSTLKSPTHIFVSPGLYTVTLVATRGPLSDTEIKIGHILVLGPDVVIATEDIAVPENRQDLRMMQGTDVANYVLIKNGIRVVVSIYEGVAIEGGFSRPQGPTLIYD